MVSDIECPQNLVEPSSIKEEEKVEKYFVPDIKGKKYGFSKRHRLKSKKEINRLFSVGEFKACGFLKFRYLPYSSGYSRVLISISKRVGNAPERNRLKRLIREALRLSGYLRNTSVDCGIYITKPLKRKPTLVKIQEYIDRFFSYLPDEYKK